MAANTTANAANTATTALRQHYIGPVPHLQKRPTTDDEEAGRHIDGRSADCPKRRTKGLGRCSPQPSVDVAAPDA